MGISETYAKLRQEIPKGVTIVLAAKQRSPAEVLEAINAGATDIGMNYVQEAAQLFKSLGSEAKKVRWHMIGHLQSNKINKSLSLFETFQTIDSFELAQEIDKKAAGKKVSVFIEVNIADEPAKSGAKPEFETLLELAKGISALPNLSIDGLMTMGPPVEAETLRPYFRKAKKLFDDLKRNGINLKHLSMGMSDSYKVAIEEGSNMVRLGTVVFGPRI